MSTLDQGRDRRQQAERYGRAGESLAALYLRLKGYRIIARDLRSPVGEIDLIVHRGNLIAFVEVKTRSADAAEVLTTAQRRRIVRAAELFLAHRPEFQASDIRFDLILVGRGRWPQHLRAAFRADD